MAQLPTPPVTAPAAPTPAAPTAIGPGTHVPFKEMVSKPTYSYPLDIKKGMWWSTGDKTNEKVALPFINIKVVDPFTQVRTSRLSIALYMPPSMAISYQSGWEEIELGPIGGYIQNYLLGNITAQSNGTMAADAAAAAGRKYVGGEILGSNAEALAQIKSGIVVNPHAAVLFKNMQFREFKLDWLVAPKNAAEAKEFREIVFQLKYAMHPGGTVATGTANSATLSSFFGVPQNFLLTFYAPHLMRLVKTHPCSLMSCTVEYNGSGVPAYSIDDHPAVYILSLHFKELSILTKDDIQKGW